MGILTVSTGTITRQFGTFACELQLTSNNITTASTTMKLVNMPKLTQDFEMQDELNDLSELRVNLSEISLSIFDTLGNGSTLFSYIDSMTLSDTIQVKVTVNSGVDFFITKKESCNYDWFSRKVTFKAQPALKYNVEVTDYENTNLPDYVSNENFVAPKDVIKAFLESQGSSPTVKIKGHFFTHGLSDISGIQVGSPRYMIFEETYVDTYAKAQDVTLGFSLIEGAIIGSMLGYSFYVRRNFAGTDIDDYQTINAGNLKSFGVEFNKRSIRNFNTSFFIQDNLGTGVDTDIGVNDDEVLDLQGTQDIDILYRINDMNTVVYSSGWQLQNAGTSVLTTSNMQTITNNAKAGYKAALGLSSSYSVKFEIFGIETLRPYQYILFGSGIHETVNGKKVRPSYIEYDLENDIVKGEGYIIG